MTKLDRFGIIRFTHAAYQDTELVQRIYKSAGFVEIENCEIPENEFVYVKGTAPNFDIVPESIIPVFQARIPPDIKFGEYDIINIVVEK